MTGFGSARLVSLPMMAQVIRRWRNDDDGIAFSTLNFSEMVPALIS